MYMDSSLLFDQDAAITVTRDSTNVIDLSNARDMGIGDDPAMKLAIYVTQTFTAAGAGTLTIDFEGSVDNSAWTVYVSTPAIALANLVAGRKLFPIDIPHRPSGAALPRYYKLVYTVATGPMTAGKITAALVVDRQDAPTYPAGLTISN